MQAALMLLRRDAQLRFSVRSTRSLATRFSVLLAVGAATDQQHY